MSRKVLAIETTCDETACAVISEHLEVLGAVVASQDKLHERFHGVVPEIAARAHLEQILPVLDKNFGPFGENRGWNSWFRVLAFDGSAAQVYVVYYGRQFPSGLFPQGSTRVGSDGLTFRQWQDDRLPDGFVGSAVIVADRPVVVVANLESDVFVGDPVMLYNGVPIK